MKLSKTEIKEKNALANKLRDAFDNLDELTAEEKPYKEKIEKAIAIYNGAIDDARAFCEGIAQEIADFIDSKSEAWQEGDKCAAHEDFKSAYEDLEFEPISLDNILDTADGSYSMGDVENYADTLDELMEEPEG